MEGDVTFAARHLRSAPNAHAATGLLWIKREREPLRAMAFCRGMNSDHVTRRDDEALFELQLRVAKKADELVRTRKPASNLNVHCWLLAEAEIINERAIPQWLRPGAQRTPVGEKK